MATSTVLLIRSLTKLVSLLLFTPLLPCHSSVFASVVLDDDGVGSYREYDVLDTPIFLNGAPSTHGRVLAVGSKVTTVKKGAHCDVASNVCNGVRANKGKSLLSCCKNHCRNILGDRNNCGACGHRCSFGQLCCGGKCVSVGFNDSHCGKCNNACASGVKCEMGACGYAYA